MFCYAVGSTLFEELSKKMNSNPGVPDDENSNLYLLLGCCVERDTALVGLHVELVCLRAECERRSVCELREL